jgi:hypothetical protein
MPGRSPPLEGLRRNSSLPSETPASAAASIFRIYITFIGLAMVHYDGALLLGKAARAWYPDTLLTYVVVQVQEVPRSVRGTL